MIVDIINYKSFFNVLKIFQKIDYIDRSLCFYCLCDGFFNITPYISFDESVQPNEIQQEFKISSEISPSESPIGRSQQREL